MKSIELNIPQENLLTPEFLRQLCWEELDEKTSEAVQSKLSESGARRWQSELLAGPLSEALRKAPEYVVETTAHEN